MNDALFLDSPVWLERLYEKIDKNITIALEENSKTYQGYEDVIRGVYEKYPEFADIIEGKDKYKSMLLSGEGTQKLSELVRAEFNIMEMYQRAMYVAGVWDGIRLAGIFAEFGQKI